MKRTIMISLDTSLKESGYAIWINGELNDSGVLTFPANCNEDKTSWQIKALYNLFRNNKPQIIIAENLAVFNNPYTQEGLRDILGACKGYSIEHNVFFDKLMPCEWRKLVNPTTDSIPRRRTDCKKWDVRVGNMLFPLLGNNDNEVDAVLLGQAYINKIKNVDNVQ